MNQSTTRSVRSFSSLSVIMLLLVFQHVSICKAQITATQINSSSLYFKPVDALQLQLSNNGASGLGVLLRGEISGAGFNIRFNSVNLELNKGLKLVTNAEAQAKFEFNSAATKAGITAYSPLPVGNYQVNITVISSIDNEELAALAYEQEVTALNPPVLISPPDESSIDTKNPLLMWSPPLPVDARLGTVWYDLVLVEVLPNQSANDAIQRNNPMFKQEKIPATSILYPATAMPLKEGRIYAWQVHARTDATFIGSTEVFTFSLPLPVTQPETRLYGELKSKLDASVYEANEGKVYFNYREEYKSASLSFKVFNQAGEDVRKNCPMEINKQPGENQYLLDLNRCQNLPPGIYTLEVKGEKNDTKLLKFRLTR